MYFFLVCRRKGDWNVAFQVIEFLECYLLRMDAEAAVMRTESYTGYRGLRIGRRVWILKRFRGLGDQGEDGKSQSWIR